MAERAGSEGRGRKGRKVLFGVGLAVPLLAGVALIPSMASGDDVAAARSQAAHDHAAHEHAADDPGVGAELARVRRATAGFHRVEEAVAAGYELGWVNGVGQRIVGTCISHASAGAMGYHYFNAALMADNDVDPLEPEVLIYAPTDDGDLKLVAVEWVVRSAQSIPAGVSTAPSVLGMEMHILAPPPGPAFYLTHAWIWAHNPSGMFADWNPEVTCS